MSDTTDIRSSKPTFVGVSDLIGQAIPSWGLVVIVVAFFAVATFAGVVLFKVVQDIVAEKPGQSHINIPLFSFDPQGSDGPGPIDPEQPIIDPENPDTIPSGIKPSQRVTILVLGIDQPCEFIDEPNRSDSMMLVTIDPVRMTIGILSVPRDLWVPIPGFDTNRINTAFYSGESYQYPGGGPALAMETVTYNLGVHIQHYVTVNYDGFVRGIDLIGGIDIDVPEAISDPDYPDRCYGFDPFEIAEGQHHLDGYLALKYARTRATFGSDFDRAARQQAVLVAALDKALDQNISLFARAPKLWNTFQDTVTTSMSYQDVIGLALLIKDIPTENIYRAVIDYNYVVDYTAPDQARVLVPIRERIRDLRDQFFSNALPSTSSEAAEKMIAENVGIEVLNGTFVEGLAGDTADYLERRGFTIGDIGDAEEKGQLNTQLIALGDAPATLDFLAQILEVDPTHIFQGDQVGDKPQIRVILGADWTISAPDQ